MSRKSCEDCGKPEGVKLYAFYPARLCRLCAQLREQRSELDNMKTLDRLPEMERIAVLLKYVEGAGYGDIAAKLNITQQTARSLVSRGLATARRAVTLDQLRNWIVQTTHE